MTAEKFNQQQEKIKDHINYLILLWAMFREREEGK